jgi:hypothetical protein
MSEIEKLRKALRDILQWSNQPDVRHAARKALENTIVEIPPMVEHEENVADKPTIQIDSMVDVFSWRPGPANSDVPCTEVHIVIPVSAEARVALRLKTPRALDTLVGALLQHRKDVWP